MQSDILGSFSFGVPVAYNPHLDAFANAMHPDGGWGYAPGLSPQLEPSCLGLLAEPRRQFIETNALGVTNLDV